LRPEAYSEIFQILKYYVNTRDFSESSFWNTDSNLFVSATRPGDRFFGFVDLHRLSSIFLEPVSLGNYCVIVVVFLVACWPELSARVRYYLAVSTLALLIGCDGRLAAASILIVLISAIFVRRIPSRWSFVYLPIMLLLAAIFTRSSDVEAGQDNFSGRVAGSMVVLSRVDFSGLLGLDASAAGSAMDSGITYFVLTQSFVGVILIWLAVCLFPNGRRYSSRLYVHGTAIFIPLNLLVSYSFFSIKVASVIWFYFGYFLTKDDSEDLESSSLSNSPFSSMAPGTEIGRATI